MATHGFRSVLTLDPESKPDLGTDDVKRAGVRIPLEDGPDNDIRLISRAVTELRRLVATQPPVFVHCHAGRSRSAIVVAGYFMKRDGLTAQEAIHQVSQKRELAITDGLVRLLERLEE
ncbi:MAG: dual specificity protein phosphatase family protein [Planctomycetes bacterium]|nr:dual specificity protein phosphatase family protein [Planctomycetota bacterium]